MLLWNQNVDTIQTSGVDIDVAWRGPATAIGRLGFHLNGTYITDFTLRFSDMVRADRAATGSASSCRIGSTTARSTGPTARGRRPSVTISRPAYNEPDLTKCGETTCDSRLVGDYSVWDLVGRYTGFRNVALTAGVKNLFDRNPPRAFVGSGRFQSGYDPGYADPRGRTFYAGVTVTFK